MQKTIEARLDKLSDQYFDSTVQEGATALMPPEMGKGIKAMTKLIIALKKYNKQERTQKMRFHSKKRGVTKWIKTK